MLKIFYEINMSKTVLNFATLSALSSELFIPPEEIRLPAVNERPEIIIRKPRSKEELLSIQEKTLEAGGAVMESTGEKEGYDFSVATTSLTDFYLIQLGSGTSFDLAGYIKLAPRKSGVLEWGKFLALEYRGKGLGQVTFAAVLENIILPAIGKKYNYLTYSENFEGYICKLAQSEIALKHAVSTVDIENYPSLKVNINSGCTIEVLEKGGVFICRYPGVKEKREFSNKLLEICSLQSQISDIRLSEIAEKIKKAGSEGITTWLEYLPPAARGKVVEKGVEKGFAGFKAYLSSRRIIDGTLIMLKEKIEECNQKIAELLASLTPDEHETIASLNELRQQNNEDMADSTKNDSAYSTELPPVACGAGYDISVDHISSEDTSLNEMVKALGQVGSET